MSCTELLRTQAFLDGELDDKAAAEVERHIAGCAECRAFGADAAALSDAMKRGLTRFRAPENLRARVSDSLAAEENRKVVPFHARRRSFWLGAVSGAAVSASAAALAFMIILPPSAATLAESVTDTHTKALMSGHMIEVVSSDHHTVKPWFAGRVPISPPVTDFVIQGYPLIGGRVDDVAGSKAAVVVYRRGKHVIDLFVWADRGSPLPGQSTRHGYHSIFWKSGDLDFAAVADTQRTELNAFVSLVRSQPE